MRIDNNDYKIIYAPLNKTSIIELQVALHNTLTVAV